MSISRPDKRLLQPVSHPILIVNKTLFEHEYIVGIEVLLLPHGQIFDKVVKHIGSWLDIDHFHILRIKLTSLFELTIFLYHSFLVVQKYRHNRVQRFDELFVHIWWKMLDELRFKVDWVIEDAITLCRVRRLGQNVFRVVGSSNDKHWKC